MPVRYGGSNSAITKSYRPSESQRIARTTARKVIDLTQESEEEEAEGGSEAEPEKESEVQQDSEEQGDSDEQEESEEQDSEEQEESEGQESAEQEESEEHENPDAESQEQDCWTMRATPGISYAVTGYHHRPWGGGDEFRTVGIFNTEKEAKWAALDHYRKTCEDMADGWEYYWRGEPGGKEITLVAKVEDYEIQQETYRGTINRIQHQEKPWSPYVTRSDPRIVQGQAKPNYVYVVKEERQNFFNELWELINCKVHKIYKERVAANNAAEELHRSHCVLLGSPRTVKHETSSSLVSIIIEDQDEQIAYLITVEKRQLL